MLETATWLQELLKSAPDYAEFRAYVDALPNQKNSFVIKALYLTACRVSELVMKTTEYDLRRGMTKPFGLFMRWEITEYLGEKVLLLIFVTAKRYRKKGGSKIVADFLTKFIETKKVDDKLLSKLRNILVWKIIALPCNPIYEPWTLDLLRYIKKNGTLGINLTRQRIWEIVKKSLKPFWPDVKTHSLRHWRLTHLAGHYNFDPYELVIYAGWTFRTGFSALGLPSGQLDTYLHLGWKRYFPKLLRPLKG